MNRVEIMKWLERMDDEGIIEIVDRSRLENGILLDELEKMNIPNPFALMMLIDKVLRED